MHQHSGLRSSVFGLLASSSWLVLFRPRRDFARKHLQRTQDFSEGTRKRVDKWKSGFYYVAQKAMVPICTGFLDYKKKEAGFGPVINITENSAEDLAKIKTFYSTISPCIPQNFNVNGIMINPPKA